MSQTSTSTADEMEQFMKFLEGKIGHFRKDQETIDCLKSIMQTKLNVFGDLYVE